MKRSKFLENMTNDNNHRLLLWNALNSTGGLVVEYGSGYGSTIYLRKYCQDAKREFISYDNGFDWSKIHDSNFTDNWDNINHSGSVILIDHAPGERRWIDIEKYKDSFDIIVIHDSEPIGAGDYKYENIWGLFKYRIDVKSEGAWATAVSNKIDLSQFIGDTYKQYIIS